MGRIFYHFEKNLLTFACDKHILYSATTSIYFVLKKCAYYKHFFPHAKRVTRASCVSFPN